MEQNNKAKNKVYIVKCPDYNQVETKLAKLFEIMGIPAENNPLLIEAKKRNMYPSCIDEVQVIGFPKEQLRIKGFKLPASYTIQSKKSLSRGSLLMGLVKTSYTVEPRIIKSECVACGACEKACPCDAIKIINKISIIDKNKCIRCYCCHEMCQYNPIELHQSILYKIANRKSQ